MAAAIVNSSTCRRTCALPPIAIAKTSVRRALCRHAHTATLVVQKPVIVFCCRQPGPTLGHLVEVAHSKNKQLVKDDTASVNTLLLQQQLWTKLQGTFFAPGADATAMSKRSALTFEERHSGCGCPYSKTNRLSTIATTSSFSTSKYSRRAQTCHVLLHASSPKSNHPLASSITVRSGIADYTIV